MADERRGLVVPEQGFCGDDIDAQIRHLTPDEARLLGLRRERSPLAISAMRRLDFAKLVAMVEVPQQQPVLVLRVRVVLCRDDDGGNAHNSVAELEASLPKDIEDANAIFAARGAGIRLSYRSGDIEVRDSTLLNQDFLIPAGTNLNTGEDDFPLSDEELKELKASHEEARQAVGEEFPGKLVFILAAGTKLVHDGSKWVRSTRTYAYSWEDKSFVSFPSTWRPIGAPQVAHEVGHYLHLWHTFSGKNPETIADAADIIRAHVEGSASEDDGL